MRSSARTLGCRQPYSFVRWVVSFGCPVKVMDVALISPDTMPPPNRRTPVGPNSTRWLRCRMVPLWLLLAAFVGHTAMPPALWGSLSPRESEQESDSLSEIWKCTAGGESRALAPGRVQRRAGALWGPPRDVRIVRQSRRTAVWADVRLQSCEWSAWNGLGSPLRC
jgi:hypothetical protein